MAILQSGKRFLTTVLASLSLWLAMLGDASGSEAAGDGVYVDGEWLVYRGELSAELNQAASELLLASPGLRGLKVNSPGGPVDLGMDLGEWMLDAGLDVYIDGYCHSSCANYVFLAGANKILSADAVVGWHGSTRQWSDAEDMCGVPENRLDARIAHRECVARAGDAPGPRRRVFCPPGPGAPDPIGGPGRCQRLFRQRQIQRVDL